jgi:hypothetical protein
MAPRGKSPRRLGDGEHDTGGIAGKDAEGTRGRKQRESGVKVVGDLDLQDAVGGVLDSELDAGFTAEDGRVEKGARNAQGGSRRQGEDIGERECEDEGIPEKHETEPMDSEETGNGAEDAGREQHEGAACQRGGNDAAEAALGARLR